MKTINNFWIALILFNFLIIPVYAIDISPISKQKIEPELVSALKNLSQDSKISVIMISNYRLGQKDMENLESLDAKIARNFSLAPWYEVEIPAGKVDSVPVGMQIMCAKNEESKMLSIAKMIEGLK